MNIDPINTLGKAKDRIAELEAQLVRLQGGTAPPTNINIRPAPPTPPPVTRAAAVPPITRIPAGDLTVASLKAAINGETNVGKKVDLCVTLENHLRSALEDAKGDMMKQSEISRELSKISTHRAQLMLSDRELWKHRNKRPVENL